MLAHARGLTALPFAASTSVHHRHARAHHRRAKAAADSHAAAQFRTQPQPRRQGVHGASLTRARKTSSPGESSAGRCRRVLAIDYYMMNRHARGMLDAALGGKVLALVLLAHHAGGANWRHPSAADRSTTLTMSPARYVHFAHDRTAGDRARPFTMLPFGWISGEWTSMAGSAGHPTRKAPNGRVSPKKGGHITGSATPADSKTRLAVDQIPPRLHRVIGHEYSGRVSKVAAGERVNGPPIQPTAARIAHQQVVASSALSPMRSLPRHTAGRASRVRAARATGYISSPLRKRSTNQIASARPRDGFVHDVPPRCNLLERSPLTPNDKEMRMRIPRVYPDDLNTKPPLLVRKLPMPRLPN